jgi:D-sedoheptulose 7-phosphate isomerase
MIERIKQRVSESIEVKRAFDEDLYRRIESAARTVIEAYRHQRKAVFMGNGGSAADAQHLAAELVGRFARDRKALPALALNANTSSLTALSNDYDYGRSFSKQVEAFVVPGDVVIGISTSGNSENVVQALKEAKARGAVTVALTGRTGGRVGPHADILINVPSDTVARIQEAHILVGHIICELIESALFPG